ncbi:MAG: non-hydrolyzing UDP-N-acetylglucosamine 2-epimerase [bacterium]
MKKNILFIFGTRPEAIKLAPLIVTAKSHDKFNIYVCSTGQHKEMLSQVLDFFDVKVDFSLALMKPNQSLSYLTAEAVKKIDDVLSKLKIDLVVVQGDTTTAFVGSLVSYYHKIPVAHVEAGLRTFNKYSPFPEEANRSMISKLADFNFAPTEKSRENLLKENVDRRKIFVTGNTVIDALQTGRDTIKKDKWKIKLQKHFSYIPDDKKLILVTGHRRESFGKPFENICRAIKKIAAERKDSFVVYPVHLNPNVRNPVLKILGKVKNISLIEPVSYPEMIYLMERSFIVLTDSGGIQEEAPTFGKPVFVMREVTERPEGIEAGVAKLVGTDAKKIFVEVTKAFEDESYYLSFSLGQNPYGDGHASERFYSILRKELS